MTTRWFCHDCPAHGETTGTEAGADAKHARSAGHCTSTTTSAEWVERRTS